MCEDVKFYNTEAYVDGQNPGGIVTYLSQMFVCEKKQ